MGREWIDKEGVNGALGWIQGFRIREGKMCIVCDVEKMGYRPDNGLDSKDVKLALNIEQA